MLTAVRPLSGKKRTSATDLPMSANDPKQTSANLGFGEGKHLRLNSRTTI